MAMMLLSVASACSRSFSHARGCEPLVVWSPLACVFVRARVAVVFGIVTNTFSTLREAREAITSDITSRCCICGVNRNELEKDSQSFQAHVGGLHNVRCLQNMYTC